MEYPLIGFLSPDGTFSPCRSYEHMDLAKRLIVKHAPEREQRHGYQNEMVLIDELGYVAFFSRGCTFKGKYLSDEQRFFIEEHISDALNSEQMDAIETILQIDTVRRKRRAAGNGEKD